VQEGMQTTHDGDLRQVWTREEDGEGVHWSTRSALRTITWSFRARGEHLEAYRARVRAWNGDHDACTVHFDPPLPDARARFAGAQESWFIIDVNGQRAHGLGRVRSQWDQGVMQLAVMPETPSWTTDRPLHSRVRWRGDQALVDIQRVG